MSKNNIVLIQKIDNEYNGYDISIETKHSELYRKKPVFVVKSLYDAIIEAQKIRSEYGYRFINLEEERTSHLFGMLE